MAVGVPPERVMLVHADQPADGSDRPGWSVGSGTLIGARLVLTAAHVVFCDDSAPSTLTDGAPIGTPLLPLSEVRAITATRFRFVTALDSDLFAIDLNRL